MRQLNALLLVLALVVGVQGAIHGGSQVVGNSANGTVVYHTARVYRSGVTLKGEAKVAVSNASLQKGVVTIALGGLPRSQILRDSVDAVVVGCNAVDASLRSLLWTRAEQPSNDDASARTKELKVQLDEAQRELQRAIDKFDAKRVTVGFQQSKWSQSNFTGLSAQETLERLRNWEAGRVTLKDEELTLTIAVESAKEKVKELQRKLQDLQPPIEDIVVLNVALKATGEELPAGGCTVGVKLSMYVPKSVEWHPSYAVHLGSSNRKAKIVTRASLIQRTGIDLNDVSLQLSSAEPLMWMPEPPRVHSPMLAFEAPPPMFSSLYARNAHPRGAMSEAMDDMNDGAVPESVTLSDSATTVLTGGAAHRTKRMERGFEQAQMVQGNSQSSTTFEFLLPGQHTLFDGQATLLGLQELEVDDVELQHFAMPSQSQMVFLKAKLKNTSPQPILEGKATFYIDDAFAGVGALPTVFPGREQWINVGVDPAVTIAQDAVVHKDRTTTSFISEGSRTKTYHYVLQVANKRPSQSLPIYLTLEAGIPHTKEESIDVEIVQPSSGKKCVTAHESAAGTDQQVCFTATMSEEKYVKYVIPELVSGVEVGVPLKYTVKYPKDKAVHWN